MIFAILMLFFLLTLFVHLALAAGLLWASFNALLCFKAAKKRALTGWPYAVAGAAYSILFVLPGLYLLLRLRDNTIHRSQVIAAYALCGLAFLILTASSYGLFIITAHEGARVSSMYGYFALLCSRLPALQAPNCTLSLKMCTHSIGTLKRASVTC